MCVRNREGKDGESISPLPTEKSEKLGLPRALAVLSPQSFTKGLV